MLSSELTMQFKLLNLNTTANNNNLYYIYKCSNQYNNTVLLFYVFI